MIRRQQYGHRPTTNEQIVRVLQESAGRWTTTNEIVKRIRIGSTRGVGRRMTILCREVPELEMMIESSTHKRYYRYNAEANTAEAEA